MRLVIQPQALDTLYDVADFINGIHTSGAGEFWVTDFIMNLQRYAHPHAQYAPCHHKKLAAKGLSCIIYKQWVIAFKIEGEEFIVHLIIRGNLLK